MKFNPNSDTKGVSNALCSHAADASLEGKVFEL